ncbi:hypothetical protein CAN33_0054915 [Aspergillus niger]|uniref:Uncharacterized protein n=1 Tax=Aspergillus niger TaxID=5061 RepID=A0A505IAP6_ASPNG|nr:hypothetical protein CAN33_0054915 [Aspergillus niger]
MSDIQSAATSAALTIRNPRQQSGQEFVCQTYKLMNRLRRKGNPIKILWVPTSEDNKLLGLAKEQARAATHEDAIPQAQVSRMKSATLDLAQAQAATSEALPGDVGRHVNEWMQHSQESTPDSCMMDYRVHRAHHMPVTMNRFKLI